MYKEYIYRYIMYASNFWIYVIWFFFKHLMAFYIDGYESNSDSKHTIQ